MPFKPRLILRIVWSADFDGGADLARHIYSRLCRDTERPASRGLGVPVYFHFGDVPAATGLPGSLELDAAETTVIIVLLDEASGGNAGMEGLRQSDRVRSRWFRQASSVPPDCVRGQGPQFS